MNKIQHFFSILILLVVFMFAVSCDSVNSDAKEAASLTNKSIEKTSQLKLEEAEKLYRKSQTIIKKYESHRKWEKFSKLYQQYRDEGKIIPQEQNHQ
ncbi:MAG: hypothetical protein VB075_07655 [Petrimonas sp.]|uniref:hypothetical protein n=1 Tax=Petrimonas sp. TaxID=2023866 RepID=UPI002B3EDA5D|nr:hypothetical protein [Petrimonas sp.]MEA4997015.1 hypothetical protein [Petrimonas sp.]MEA5044431.1 hypothetical protein [Petrimonas sp.]